MEKSISNVHGGGEKEGLDAGTGLLATPTAPVNTAVKEPGRGWHASAALKLAGR
jgi:hypothetical protein